MYTYVGAFTWSTAYAAYLCLGVIIDVGISG